ncbi:MAG: hypothetical protein HQK51_06460 [Oligoflexia bacterium]|nr:hypothetical protein [Oligoflexia bacterium]
MKMKNFLINLLMATVFAINLYGCNGSGNGSSNASLASSDNSSTTPVTLTENNSSTNDISKCAETQYFDSSKNTCVLKCLPPQLYDFEKKTCYDSFTITSACTGDYVFISKYNSCGCPENSFQAENSPNSPNSCACQRGQEFDHIQKKCITERCKEGFEIIPRYSYLGCVKKCETGTIFDFDVNGCRKECTGNNYWSLKDFNCLEARPLKTFSENITTITSLIVKKNKKAKVCLSVSNSANTKDNIAKIIKNIKKAINIWIEPLRTFAINNEIINEIDVEIQRSCNENPGNFLFSMMVAENGSDSYGAGVISLSTKNVDNISAYLHEIGHAIGFGDHYYLPGTQPAHIHRPCHPGYDENITIMCVDDTDNLKGADVIAIKRKYCRFYPDDPACKIFNINKSSDIDSNDFMSCETEDKGNKVIIQNKYEYSNDYRPGIVNDRISDHIMTVTKKGGHFISELTPMQEDFSKFIWKYEDLGNKNNNITIDFINNKADINLTNEEGNPKIYNGPIYNITDNGTKIEFICEIPNTFLRYQIIKKLREGPYPYLIWEPAY